MFGDELWLTWDRDPITNGNSISNNNTFVEVKNPGQEEFRSGSIGGILHGIEKRFLNSCIHTGENIVRVRITTGNVSIIDGVITRYIPSDWGYTVLIKGTNGNITLRN